MEIIDRHGQKEFSSAHSPIHCHPAADEIYHVLEGKGLFNDGTRELDRRAKALEEWPR